MLHSDVCRVSNLDSIKVSDITRKSDNIVLLKGYVTCTVKAYDYRIGALGNSYVLIIDG